VLEIVLVVVEIGKVVGETGGAGTLEWNFDLIPALGYLKDDAAHLRVEMILYLVVASKVRVINKNRLTCLAVSLRAAPTYYHICGAPQ